MENINQSISLFLKQAGVHPSDADWVLQLILIAGIVLISFLCTKLFRHLVIPVIHKITARTKATWDDYLFNGRMLKSMCRMVPPVIWYTLLPLAFPSQSVQNILQNIALIYLVITTLMLINSFLDSLYEISNEHEKLRNRPLKGIYQMIKLMAAGVGAIFILSIIIDKDATAILAGLGASAAVLMLIFKDSDNGQGAQLRQNDNHHSSLCSGQRFLSELEGDARNRRTKNHALRKHRHEHRPFLLKGRKRQIHSQRLAHRGRCLQGYCQSLRFQELPADLPDPTSACASGTDDYGTATTAFRRRSPYRSLLLFRHAGMAGIRTDTE